MIARALTDDELVRTVRATSDALGDGESAEGELLQRFEAQQLRIEDLEQQVHACGPGGDPDEDEDASVDLPPADDAKVRQIFEHQQSSGGALPANIKRGITGRGYAMPSTQRAWAAWREGYETARMALSR